MTACQACKAEAPSDELRARVLGWRIWSGTTIGGQETSVVFCPACCGEAGVDEKTGESVGWKAECRTCFVTIDDEWDDDKPEAGWTKKDCEEWEDDHKCEPDVQITAPVRQPVSA